MRWTGASFLTGAAAISSLPPLCGFVGEWLILSAAFRAAARFPVGTSAIVVLAALALATSAGLAAASLARLFGTSFLGRPRTDGAERAQEVTLVMRAPQVALAAACLAIGLLPAQTFVLVQGAASRLVGGAGAEDPVAAATLAMLSKVSCVAVLLVAVVLLLALLRSFLRGARGGADAETWGCGYARPSSRLQYTASGFGQPLVRVFDAIIAPRADERRPEGFLPTRTGRSSEVSDRVEDAFYIPLFRAVARRLESVRRTQDGRLNKYMLQIVAVLVVCLLWSVVSRWVLQG